jgi:hypothetical protein
MTGNTQITPAEWVAQFLSANPEKQQRLAARMIQHIEQSHRCFMEDHKGAIAYRNDHRCPGEQESYQNGYELGYAKATHDIEDAQGGQLY